MWAIRYINQIKEFHIFTSPVSYSFHNFIIWKSLTSWSLRLFSRNLIWVSIFIYTDWKGESFIYELFFYCKQRNICFQSSIILLCFFSGWNSLLDYRYFETIYLKKIVPQSTFCLSSTQIIEQGIERILRGKIKAYCSRR